MLWLTSDTHLGCDKLIENTRTLFTDTKQHDDHVLDMMNMCAKPNDTLVIVGDFCKEKPGRYRQKIKCKNIFFILGNHDKEAKIRAAFGGNVWTRKIVKFGEYRIVCDHHPSCFWDRSHYGVYHAYGHLHWNAEREAMMDLGFPGRRSHDVGVDSANAILDEYRPWSADEFIGFIGPNKGHDIIKREDRWEERDY